MLDKLEHYIKQL